MICPLITIEDIAKRGDAYHRGWACLKEECAWWDEDGSQCSYLAKLKVLVNIESCLELIVKKMPHAGQ